MKNILVLGGTGAIGSHFLNKNKKHNLFCLVRKSKKNFRYLSIHLSSMIKSHLKHGFF